MSKHMIFGGILAAIVGIMIGASLLTDKSQHRADTDVRVHISSDGLVISQDDDVTVIQDKNTTYRCDEKQSSVTITRDNGTEITISCD